MFSRHVRRLPMFAFVCCRQRQLIFTRLRPGTSSPRRASSLRTADYFMRRHLIFAPPPSAYAAASPPRQRRHPS